MTLNTPRGYTYPEYTDPADFPAQIQDFATDVDLDITNNLETPITEALDAPSVRAFKAAGGQAVAVNTNVTITFTTETYDNDNMFNVGVSTTNVVVNTPGIYFLSGSVNLAPTGAAGGAAALILASTGGVVPNPVGVSHNLDNDKDTSLSCMTLHRVAVVPETITMFVRHNHANPLTAAAAQLTATRISR
ncbi:hypothetical protein AB0B30_32435 [Streptomyces narbonensis]|uniref:Uncharacterized protein n=1 Tax=Streptomyces narbonensis TaxID=67333 RepID=A0ABV3CIY6_9ACTN